jgi:tripartite-type tricarboxylate transporter receptor subunit TctC
MPYRVPEDFAFVAGIAKSPLLVAVNGKLPFRTMADLIAYAKANPGKVRYGTSGVGGGGHLGREAIARAAGVEMVHIPYPGSVQAVTGTAGGFVEFVLAGAATVKPHTDSGALRVLATLDTERHPQFPEVPTIAEAGFPNLRVVAYFGILAPAGVPDAVLMRIRGALAGIGNDPKVAERFRATGAEPAYLDGEAFTKFAIGDLRQWQAVAKSANIELKD